RVSNSSERPNAKVAKESQSTRRKIQMNLLRSLRVLCALCVPVFAFAQAPQPPQRLAPGDNLVVEGIPAIPASLAEKAGRYGDVRSAFVQSWNPKRREMLVLTRFSETAQVHIVRRPEGDRTQLTFFPDRVAGASFQPVEGRYFVFTKDVGGGEWFQLYRYDMEGGAITLLTDGKSRNESPVFSRDGRRIAYTSTRRTRRH